MKTYYHDRGSKTLSIAPVSPTVSEKTDSRHNTITTVTAFIESYCYDGKQGPTVTNLSYPAREQYTSRDSSEDAVRFFKRSNYPDGVVITVQEYFDLRQKYEEELTTGPA